MIQVYSDSFKLSQDYYDRLIFSLPIHQLECSCGETGFLIFYGFYNRKGSAERLMPSFPLPLSPVPRSACRTSSRSSMTLQSPDTVPALWSGTPLLMKTTPDTSCASSEDTGKTGSFPWAFLSRTGSSAPVSFISPCSSCRSVVSRMSFSVYQHRIT